MRMTRQWAMPSADTFDVPCIGEFVKSYLRNSKGIYMGLIYLSHLKGVNKHGQQEND